MKPYKKKRIRAIFRRILRKATSKFDPPATMKDLSPIQRKSVTIIRRMINKEESTLLIAPISGANYIEWKNYFIKFGDGSTVITNGKFSYYVWLPTGTTSQLTEFFYQKVEERRKNMESHYDQNTIQNFDDMLNSLSSENI